MDLQTQIAALPRPQCREDLLEGEHCTGPFERITATCRPGEVDVAVRCQACQAQACYSIDEKTGQIVEGEALLLLRSPHASQEAALAQWHDDGGAHVEPEKEVGGV